MSKFQPGQKVKVVGSTFMPSTETLSMIGGVYKTSLTLNEFPCYYVRDGDGKNWLFSESDLEAVDEPTNPITELTLQQIADQFNIPIEQVRIKG